MGLSVGQKLSKEGLVESKKPIKEGDLVTISLGEYQTVSNTYRVAKKLDVECVLQHPLAPECYIIKKDEELNNAFPSAQNQIEKCLFFAKKNSNVLGYTMIGNLEALCFYFVIKKTFTPRQRVELTNICGKIASVLLENNVTQAIATIKENKILLDEYNYSLLNAIKKILDNSLNIKSKQERYTVFNVAGFVLAQLSNTHGEN